MAIACAVLLSVSALASATTDELERARQMVDDSLRYSEAIPLLERVLSQPDLTGTQRVEAYRLLGIASVAQGSLEAAEAAFLELLLLEPAYQLDPMLSPKILQVFDEARQKAEATPRFVDPGFSSRGTEIHFSARLRDPTGQIARVDMRLRVDGGDYRPVAIARRDDRVEGALVRPPTTSHRLVLDYYLIGFSEGGNAIARLGRDDAPSSFVLEQVLPAADPWYAQWWPWAVAGGVVIAGTTAAVLWALNRDPNEPAGTLDPIYVGLRGDTP